MKILIEEKYIITRAKNEYEIVAEENVENLDSYEKLDLYEKMLYACSVLNKASKDYYCIKTIYKEIEKVGN